MVRHPNRFRFALAAMLLFAAACGEVRSNETDSGAGASIDAAVAPDAGVSHALTVTINGAGHVSSGTEIDCEPTCAADFASGDTVTLTATPDEGSGFLGWSGDCGGDTPECTVTMSGPREVTAKFGASNIVFLTSGTYTGALGGVAGADTVCTDLAAAAGYTGTFRAWLSTTTESAVSRLGNAPGWVRVDGKPFALSAGDIAAGRILYPPRIQENGVDIFASGFVRTGTNNVGSLEGGTCLDWTTDVNTETALFGYADGVNIFSSSDPGGLGFVDCLQLYRLYCFQIDGTAPVQALEPSSRIAFVTRNTFIPGGGLAAADGLCATEAADAGLDGSFKALLGTAAASPLSRFNLDGPPWSRPDGAVIAATPAGWSSIQSMLDTSINQTADGADYYTFEQVWTGAGGGTFATVPAAGTATCLDWTTADPATFGAAGWKAGGSYGFENVSGIAPACDQPLHLYCLEE